MLASRRGSVGGRGGLTSSPRRRLIVRRIAPALAQRKRLGPTHHAIALEVRFIPHNNDRHVLVVLDANNLLAQLRELLQTAAAGDGEDKEEALACLHVQLPRCGIRYLVSSHGAGGAGGVGCGPTSLRLWGGSARDREARSLDGLTELLSSCGVETVRRELGALGAGQGGVPYISNMHCLPYKQRY